MPSICLFDAATIHHLDWPATPDGDTARRWLGPFIERGPSTFIVNVHTDLRLLRVDDVILPITVTHYHPHNSYVCSPYSHYFAYGQEEFDKLGRLPAALLRLLLNPVAHYFRRSGFDDAVLVNNWLLSTNLYPPLSADQIQAVTQFLAAQFPEWPIIWRSVDAYGNPDLHRALAGLSCALVFSRQIYYQNPLNPALWRKKQLKVDRSLARRSEYRLVGGEQLTADDAPRLAHLYGLLYLDKYSPFNPQFTANFFRLALEERLLTFRAYRAPAVAVGRGDWGPALSEVEGRSLHNASLRLSEPYQKAGDIDAVLGYFSRNAIMTQPIFGYDTGKPQKLGLYRLLSLRVLQEGRERGLLINASGGAGEFKRLRGGVPALEYNAVYLNHLPPTRQRPWRRLKWLLDSIAVPIIQKYGF
jgi:hypothetical protein